MNVDFSKWAVVGHNDDSGFGRMGADLRRVIGIGRHLVIPSERLVDKPVNGIDEQWLRPDYPREEVRRLLEGVEGIFFSNGRLGTLTCSRRPGNLAS